MASFRIQKYFALCNYYCHHPLPPPSFIHFSPPVSLQFKSTTKHSYKDLVMKKLTLLLLFFFFYCVSVVSKPTQAGDFNSSILWRDEQRDDDVDVAHFQKILQMGKKLMRVSRRVLNEPGSSPPQCISKCGSCTPCKPVRVAVPPGTPVTEEYYPEAWRCKCGNRLYMP